MAPVWARVLLLLLARTCYSLLSAAPPRRGVARRAAPTDLEPEAARHFSAHKATLDRLRDLSAAGRRDDALALLRATAAPHATLDGGRVRRPAAAMPWRRRGGPVRAPEA